MKAWTSEVWLSQPKANLEANLSSPGKFTFSSLVVWFKKALDSSTGEFLIKFLGQTICICCLHWSSQNILLWVSAWEITSDSIFWLRMQLEACSISLVKRPIWSTYEISSTKPDAWLIAIDDLPSWNCPQCQGSLTVIEMSPLDITSLLRSCSSIAQLIFASIWSENTRWASDCRSIPVLSNLPVAVILLGSAKGRSWRCPAINLHMDRG